MKFTKKKIILGLIILGVIILGVIISCVAIMPKKPKVVKLEMTLESQLHNIDRHVIKYNENNEAIFNVIINADGDIENLKALDFKVLVDYKEINFEVDGSKFYTYKLDVSGKGQFIIPLKISKDDFKGANELSIYAIEGDYNKNGEDKMLANIIDVYEIDQKTKNVMEKNKIEPQTIYTKELNTDYLFLINYNNNKNLEEFFEEDYVNGGMNISGDGEMEVYLRQKNFSGNGEQLIFAQMDDRIIKIDNKDYITYIPGVDCTAFLDEIKITIPTTSGIHRLNFVSIIKDSEGNVINIINSNPISIEKK